MDTCIRSSFHLAPSPFFSFLLPLKDLKRVCESNANSIGWKIDHNPSLQLCWELALRSGGRSFGVDSVRHAVPKMDVLVHQDDCGMNFVTVVVTELQVRVRHRDVSYSRLDID